jgi:hypothetical protein
MIRRVLPVALLVAALILAIAVESPAFAKTSEGFPFHDGDTVRTVVTPHALPFKGVDPLYEVTNGVDGQLGIAGVAPGDGPYHGGKWMVFDVTFNQGVSPYLLTSDEAVFASEAAGDVAVARDGAADFHCPVQP